MSPDHLLLANLNDAQREAVLHTGSPLLILAGAGSGKTRVITTRIAWALETLGTRPHSIAAVTFTNKAAREMEERLKHMTDRAEGVTVRTFHSFCSLLLRMYGAQAGINPSFLIYDEADAMTLLRNLLKQQYAKNEIRQLFDDIMRAKDLCIAPDGDVERVNRNPAFAEIYRQYEERLVATGNLDFGDLIMKTVFLLREFPIVREAVQSRFSTILVDEYQDSNAAQFILLKELYGPGTSLSVVGDDDQSIYSFRGAEISNILTFHESFPGTRVIRLEQNYRSTGRILAAASSVVAHNQGRLGKTLLSTRGEGGKISLRVVENHEAEALQCAKLYDENPDMETAIIYRVNSQSRSFEEVFTRFSIPFLLVGSLRFYERAEVKDAIALLSLFVNPRDEIAFRRIINTPVRGIGEKTLAVILEFLPEAKGDVLECLRISLDSLSKRARTGAGAFLTLHRDLANQMDLTTTSMFIHEALFKSGLYDFYREQDKVEGTTKCRNLEELVSAAEAFPGGKDALAAFLEGTTLRAPEYEEPAGKRVMLITAHNTKGLEFDRVIITGCEDGVFPMTRTNEWEEPDRDAIEEERRLFYVAMTRARELLILFSARRRLLFGRWSDSIPSRFLSEIPQEILEITDNTAKPEGLQTRFQRGDRVFHDDFGYGFVIESSIKGGHEAVKVRLDSGRTAVFIPEYTSLMKTEGD